MIGFSERCRRAAQRMMAALLILAMLTVVSSCKDKNDEPHEPTVVPRTVLVYMAACNSLGTGGYDDDDLEEMKTAALNGDLNGGRLLVYHCDKYGECTLLEITNNGEAKTLKTYTDENSSVSAQRMSDVIDDVKETAPAKDYGLVLWSHANGWLQTGLEDDTFTRRAFGLDKSKSMNVTTLAKVLDGRGFSFIYFDCCYMGCVEVMYELRHVTPYIVASPSEIPVDGMPYDKNIKCFFESTPDLVSAATNTYNYYLNQNNAYNRTCTIAVINTAGMDQLAAAAANIYEASQGVLPNGKSYVQKYMLETQCWHYDFDDYMEQLAEGNSDELYNVYETIFLPSLNNVVLYSAATPRLWNSLLLDHCSGLSSFILTSEDDASLKNYNTLSWYTDVASRMYYPRALYNN
jgi:hypothetical protein